jgi:asparagine synthase (glutamine-hydrolysing)
MSGICGWAGTPFAGERQPASIESMAAALTHHAGNERQSVEGGRSAAAAVGTRAEGLDSHRADGLLSVVYGNPRWTDRESAEFCVAHGLAASIARAYRRDGADFLRRLKGSFALAVLANDGLDALLAIDRIGAASITYCMQRGVLVFASNADSLNRHPASAAPLNRQSLFNYVYFHMVPGNATISEDQWRLAPGTYVALRAGKPVIASYWEMHYSEDVRTRYPEQKEAFRGLLLQAVREASQGARTGTFLSGGTDSSTLAGLLTQVAREPVNTYSIGFAAPGYDEMSYARIAAKHFGTRHHEYYVTPADVVNAVPEMAKIFDQPFGNASAVPTYYCARLAKTDGIERLLGGDGGDELFGGNARYATQYLFSLYNQLPATLRNRLIEPGLSRFPAGDKVPWLRKLKSYVRQASMPMPARLESYNLLQRFGPQQVFCADFLVGVDMGQPLELLAHTYTEAHAESELNRMLALDLKFTLADNDLRKVTRACELAGVASAFPLLDDDLVAFSAQLAPHLKLKRTRLRHFFKQALGDFLPSEILTKQKHGFGLPFGLWLASDPALRDLALDSLASLRGRNIVRAEFIDELCQARLSEHASYYGTMVWVLMMLEHWFDQRAKAVSQVEPGIHKVQGGPV